MVGGEWTGKEVVQHNFLGSLQTVRWNLQTRQNTKPGGDVCHGPAPISSHRRPCSLGLKKLRSSLSVSFLGASDPGLTSSPLKLPVSGQRNNLLRKWSKTGDFNISSHLAAHFPGHWGDPWLTTQSFLFVEIVCPGVTRDSISHHPWQRPPC